jgi:hypothetical protein
VKRIALLGIILAGLLAGTAQGAGVYVAKVPGRVLFERVPHLPTAKGKIRLPATLEPVLIAAQSYWGVEYPPLCYNGAIFLGDPGPEDAGRATMPTRAGTACEMTIDPNSTPEERCRIGVHEFGHWLGLPHTSNPADVMYELGDWWAVVPPCEGP